MCSIYRTSNINNISRAFEMARTIKCLYQEKGNLEVPLILNVIRLFKRIALDVPYFE